MRTVLLLALGSVVSACAGGGGNTGPQGSAPAALVGALTGNPEGPWRQLADPGSAGWSASGLDSAHALAERIGSAAVLVVQHGRVVAAWGAVERPLPAYSVRKTLLGVLYGMHVDAGRIDLDATLESLGIEEREPLTPQERSARVRDLLGSRSGVFLPAAYTPAAQNESRPARGSASPGQAFFYNNWDFNVLGTILTRQTGADLFEDFSNRVAGPLGMEDFTVADGGWVLEPSRSQHPAYTFRISARDLARVGQLYLRGGVWDGTRLVSEAWIAKSWTTDGYFRDGWGYGFLWWIGGPDAVGPQHPASLLNRYERYMALGTGAQVMMVLPELDLVLVHRSDGENDRLALNPRASRAVGDLDVFELFAGIVAAMVGPVPASPATVPLRPRPLTSVRPAPPVPERVPLTAADRADLPGRYAYGNGVVVRVFLHDGRLFAADPVLGETELFRERSGAFFVADAPYLRLSFSRDDAGAVVGLVASEREVTIPARRVGGEAR